ncbi:MAG: hypothetical protein OHK0046_47730 [Anaerolineae bacterium]
MNTAEKITHLRQSHNLNITEAAHKAGVTPGTLSRIERGISTPRPSTLKKLAATFGVSTSMIQGDPDVQE